MDRNIIFVQISTYLFDSSLKGAPYELKLKSVKRLLLEDEFNAKVCHQDYWWKIGDSA